MRIRLSTGLTLGLLFALLGTISMWLSYRVNSDLMLSIVREREIDKVSTVGRVIEQLIRRESTRIEGAARLIGADSRVVSAMTAPPGQRNARIGAVAGAILADVQVDALEITGADEIIVYRHGEPRANGTRNPSWGIAEAIDGQNRLVSNRRADGMVGITVIEPLRNGVTIAGALSVGILLDQTFFNTLGRQTGAELALLTRAGQVSGSSTTAAGAIVDKAIDKTALTAAFEQKIPVFRVDELRHRTDVYLPLLVVDEAYVLLVQLDSSPVYRALARSTRLTQLYAVAILAAGLLMGALALRVVLRPLARLRRRAQATALELTGEAIQVAEDDEVGSIVQVLETLTGRLATRNRELEAARSAAEFSSGILRATIDSTPDGILVFDANAKVSAFNAAWMEMFKVPTEMAARGDAVELREHLAAQCVDGSLLSGRPYTQAADGDVMNFFTYDGRILERRVFRQKINGIPAGAVIHWRDVTEQATAQQKVAEAREAAEAASRAKSQFLANMSHEIRTPLNGVLGMAELLTYTSLNADQVRYVEAIGSAGRSLHALLSDILDLAKIETGKVTLEKIDFDLMPLLQDISFMYRELASSKACVFEPQFELHPDLRVTGDPTRLRQVLGNLLGNAVKFTERGRITLGCAHLPGVPGDARQWLRFTVRDTGIGIDESGVASLFQPFNQADATTTRKYGGTGLGLVICKYLVEMMGGEISVESQPGKGSVFTAAVPFVLATTMSPGRSQPNKLLETRFRGSVLVVEDNPVNLEVVEKLLQWLGLTVSTAENGALALAAVQQGRFDLVLMDCQMPVMDGFEATRRIRAWERSRPGRQAVPIVALTANALAGDREDCLAAGMTDYLSKPILKAQLLDALGRHLNPGVNPAVNPAGARQAREPAGRPRNGPDATLPGPDVRSAAAAGEKLAAFNPGILAELPMMNAQPDLLKRVIGIFLQDSQKMLAGFAADFEAGDLGGLRRRLHTFKGTSGQLGAMALFQEARRQESVLQSGGTPEAGWCALLSFEVEAFKQAVAQYRPDLFQ